MEDVLNETCAQEDLKAFEKRYNDELCKGQVSSKTQFEYACFLVRSAYPGDIHRGVMLLEDLYKRPDESGKRDYVFYLAIGNARLKEYQTALNYVRGLLQVEPGNRQVSDLEVVIKKKMEKEALKGAAIAGAGILGLGAVGFGALVGIGMALSKKK